MSELKKNKTKKKQACLSKASLTRDRLQKWSWSERKPSWSRLFSSSNTCTQVIFKWNTPLITVADSQWLHMFISPYVTYIRLVLEQWNSPNDTTHTLRSPGNSAAVKSKLFPHPLSNSQKHHHTEEDVFNSSPSSTKLLVIVLIFIDVFVSGGTWLKKNQIN